MILYWLLFIAIAICALYDWRRTVIAWIPFSMLFNQAVCLKYNSPAVSFNLAVDFTLLFIYYFSFRHSTLQIQIERNMTYFYRSSFIAYIVSYMFSMVFSIVPFTESLTITVKYFIESFVVVYLFQLALRSKRDICFFFSCLSISLLLIAIVGFVETIFKINPILSYIYYNAPSPQVLEGKMYFNPEGLLLGIGERFGLRRSFSFFHIHIAYGCACVMYFFLYIYVLLRYKSFQKLKYYLLLPIVFSGVLLCNSKTPFVGLIFFLIPLLSINSYSKFRYIIYIIIILLVGLLAFPEFFNSFFALFDSKLAEEGGGSSVALREKQYKIGIRLFLDNPVFGNGVRSLEIMIKSVSNSGLLGSESSWLKILPERGLVGAWAYIYMYYCTFKKMRVATGALIAFAFLGGVFAMEVATGFMTFSIWASIVIVIWRMYELKIRNYEL